jgi:hypothetical protein
VVVAVSVVHVVQVSVHQIVEMPVVRHPFVSTRQAVLVGCVVRTARAPLGARPGVLLPPGDLVLVDVALVRVMHVAVVQVVDMSFVAESGVAATSAVLMRVSFMRDARVLSHEAQISAGRDRGHPSHGVGRRPQGLKRYASLSQSFGSRFGTFVWNTTTLFVVPWLVSASVARMIP